MDKEPVSTQDDVACNIPCIRCGQIASALRNWEDFKTKTCSGKVALYVGKWDDYLNSKNCEECQKVAGLFRKVGDESLFAREATIRLSASSVNVLEAYLETPDKRRWLLEFWPPKHLGPTEQHCIKVDNASIKLEQIKQWIKTCDDGHSKCKSERLLVTCTPFKMMFVDVETNNIKLGDSTTKYTALSYVWGQQQDVFRTLLSNINTLKIKQSLLKDWEKLPNTIKDAIILTKSLNIRFLWVDRLCIIQDDKSSIEANISRMSSIYSNAYFTIVAGDGNEADFGLRGLHGSSGYRTYNQNMVNFQDLGFQFRPLQSLQSLMEGGSFEGSKSLWHSRGWTFQERAVSKRCLVFCQDELGSVHWECEEGMQCEILGLPIKSNSPFNFLAGGVLYPLEPSYGNVGVRVYPSYDCYNPFEFPQHRISRRLWPDCEQYYALCRGFSKRKLTYQEDALMAFSAIIQSFQPSFPGGFIFATPEFAVDDGLLWNFESNSSPMRRPTLPSWSWIGWQGAFRFDTRSREISRKPMVSWKKKDVSTGALHQLNNSYHVWGAYEGGSQLPLGWSRGTNSSIMFKYENPSTYQSAIDKSLHEEFLHPVPIAKSIQPEPCIIVWDKILYGTAQRANFTFAGWDDENGAAVNNSTGRHVGYIKRHPKDKYDPLQSYDCCVVAICETTVWANKTTRVPDFPVKLTAYPFRVEVLWVEWEDGVAYRKGTGWVVEGAWREATIQNIDLKFG